MKARAGKHIFDRLLPCAGWPWPQVRVVIGGVQVRPGDWIYADTDGVLVSKDALSL